MQLEVAVVGSPIAALQVHLRKGAALNEREESQETYMRNLPVRLLENLATEGGYYGLRGRYGGHYRAVNVNTDPQR